MNAANAPAYKKDDTVSSYTRIVKGKVFFGRKIF